LYCFFGHHRSGSTYVKTILETLCIHQGLTTATIHREEDLEGLASKDVLSLTNASLSILNKIEYSRGFHVIRDPRDIIVSSYFSHRYSHKTDVWKELINHMAFLETLDFNEGLTHEISICRKQQFEEMYTWPYDNPDVLEIKFENLIKDPEAVWIDILSHIGMKIGDDSLLSKIILLHNRIINSISKRTSLDLKRKMYVKNNLSQKQIQTTLDNYNFEKLAGNPKGIENIQNHYRKGVPGDWVNYFTDEHKEIFKKQWGELLIHLGYEQDTNW
jgi:hypothetical protein